VLVAALTVRAGLAALARDLASTLVVHAREAAPAPLPLAALA
jgi:hypothetical protein